MDALMCYNIFLDTLARLRRKLTLVEYLLFFVCVLIIYLLGLSCGKIGRAHV